VIEVGMGEHMGSDPPASELPGEAATAPAHPGVDDDAAEQVDVEGAARAAAREAQAGGQLVQRLRMLDGR
jgi:hypothetical protein